MTSSSSLSNLGRGISNIFRGIRRSLSRGFTFGYHSPTDSDEEHSQDDDTPNDDIPNEPPRQPPLEVISERHIAPSMGPRKRDFRTPQHLRDAFNATDDSDPWSPSERESVEYTNALSAEASEEWSHEEFKRDQIHQTMEFLVHQRRIRRCSASMSTSLYKQGLAERLELDRLARRETVRCQRQNSRMLKFHDDTFRLEHLKDLAGAAAATAAARLIDRRAVIEMESVGRIEQSKFVSGRFAAKKAVERFGDVSAFTFETIESVAELMGAIDDTTNHEDEAKKGSPASRRTSILQSRSNELAAMLISEVGALGTGRTIVATKQPKETRQNYRQSVAVVSRMLKRIQPVMPSMASPARLIATVEPVSASMANEVYRFEHARDMVVAEAATLGGRWSARRIVETLTDDYVKEYRKDALSCDVASSVARWCAQRFVSYAEKTARQEKIDFYLQTVCDEEQGVNSTTARDGANDSDETYRIEHQKFMAAADAASVGAKWGARRAAEIQEEIGRHERRQCATGVQTEPAAARKAYLLEHQKCLAAAEAATVGARLTDKKAVKFLERAGLLERAKFVSGRFAAFKAAAPTQCETDINSSTV
eukprot:Selendium_serpulae@DN4667_c0_g1_i1.p1